MAARRLILSFLIFLISFPVFGQPVTLSRQEEAKARQHYLQQQAYLSPDDIHGHLQLAQFCQRNGLFREALQEYRKLMSSARVSLASKQNIAKLMEVTEENAAITLYNKGVTAWREDRNLNSARNYFEEVEAVYPGAKVARKAREQLKELAVEKERLKEIAQIENKLHRSETENFVVFAPDPSLSESLARIVERKRREIIEKLGFSIFPSWEKNKARVYIYPSREMFLRYSPGDEWSGGWTTQVLQEDTQGNKEIIERTVSTYAGVFGLKESVLPHETAHLVFREFFGFSSNLPKWLDEGVAVWMEDRRHVEVRQLIEPQNLEKQSIPFEVFLYMKTYPQNPALFYAQAYSVVRYLVNRFGSSKFVAFVKELSLNEPMGTALLKSYPEEFLDLSDFEQLWKEWIRSPRG